ncbi:glycosyltransferase [Parabacteroides chinchillae]|uniref:Glycosyltransferase involved in cell wall bisynthesis n=1 Tax=Parabacteroides chinchillae TaxID=871327 RepID=A0A8G2BX42_9BACT|nr:glycosyltransferase [Parabacteroides chinchillae]SEF99011.1 Glycosyltransferase involved in cell wall bisynthesis [Parabacteroides chinchillae]
MNILLCNNSPFTPNNSFYWFYKQLTDQLTNDSYESCLYFAYLERSEESVNGVLLPDNNRYNTQKNVETIVHFIREKKIQVIFNFYLPIWEIEDFFSAIKREIPTIKFVELIHNCPNHTIQLKKYCLLNSFPRIRSKTIKDSIISLFPNLYLFLLKKKISKDNRHAYNLHDAVVVLSPSYIKEYLAIVKVKNPHKVFVIPNSLAPSSFYQSNIPIEEKSKEIVFCASLRVEKAVWILLKVWEKIQYKIPEWRLTIVGDGEYMFYCKEVIDSLNLERIELKGFTNSRPLIDRASILCLTSVIEGLPTVFLEAMSMGVVPVGFNSFSAIYDMIDNWKNGVIVPAFDIEKYAESLVELASNDELRCSMAKEAKFKVQQYNISDVYAKWLYLFKKIKLL